MKKIKILFLQKNKGYSGAEKIIITLMRLLNDDNRIGEVAYASPEGTIEEHLSKYNLKYIPLKKINPVYVKKAIKEFSPDIIHASDYTMSVIASWISGSVPVVAHLHSNPLWLKRKNSLQNIVFTLSMPLLASVVTVSKSIENEYVFYNFFKKKFKVIFNIVDIELIQKLSKSEYLNEFKYDLVYLGRFYSEKNPLFFCNIVREIKKSKKNIKAVMIGDGVLKKQVENYIKKTHLENNIKLVGYKKNPFEVIKKCKIGVIPSKVEGFGLAAVEMLALGKPVLCNNTGGLPEIIDETCGKVCLNLNDYFIEITKMLNDQEYYLKKSDGAKNKSKEFSDKESFKEKFMTVYKEVLHE